MLHVLAAALGLSLLVAQSAMAFNVVKYVGAAYLIYLGVRMLMLMQMRQARDVRSVAPQGARRALLEGVVVEALTSRRRCSSWHFCPSS